MPNQILPKASPFLDKIGATPPDALEDQRDLPVMPDSAITRKAASGGAFNAADLVQTSRTAGGGDMQVPSIVPNDQIVTSHGNLSAGGFAGPEHGPRDTPVVPGVLNRQPTVNLKRTP